MMCRYCGHEMVLDFRYERTSEDPLEEGYKCPKCEADMFYSELVWDMERWIDRDGNIEVVSCEEDTEVTLQGYGMEYEVKEEV